MCSPRPFNAVFREFITTVKNETAAPDIKKAIKAQYRAWDSGSAQISHDFHAMFQDTYPQLIDRSADVFAVLSDKTLLVEKTTAQILASVSDAEHNDRVKACVMALIALSMAANVTPTDKAVNAASLKAAEQAIADETKADALSAVILDEDLVEFIKTAGKLMRGTGGVCGLPVIGTVPEDSSIMSLAKGITDGIDPNLLEKPDGLQTLISTVSAGIGEKMTRGELDVGALMKEASALLGNMDLSALAGMMPK